MFTPLLKNRNEYRPDMACSAGNEPQLFHFDHLNESSLTSIIARYRLKGHSEIVEILLSGKLTKEHELLNDVLFSSPSAAASFVGGASLNGNLLWKDDNGRPIKDLDKH